MPDDTAIEERDALRHARALLEEAERIARIGSWEWDVTTGRLTWSDELFRILGISPSADIDLDLFFSLIYPADRTVLQAAISAALDRRESFTLDHRIARSDGSVRTLQARGRAVLDATGQVAKMVGSSQDITERKQAEVRASRLQELTSALARALTPEDVSSEIVRHGISALEASAGAVAVLDDDGEMFTLKHASGFGLSRPHGYRFSVRDANSFGDVVRSREPIFLPNLKARVDRYPHHAELVRPGSAGAFAALPLLAGARPVGAFAVGFEHDRDFDAQEIGFMQTLAYLCAQALERSRLHDAERRAREQAQAAEALSRRDANRLLFLAQVGDAVAEAGGDLSLALGRVARRTIEAIGDGCIIRLVSDDGRFLVPGAVAYADPEVEGFTRTLIETTEHPIDGGFNGRVVTTRQPFFGDEIPQAEVMANTLPSHREHLSRFPTYGLIIAPLQARGRMLGTIAMSRLEPGRPYTRDDLSLLVQIADRVALQVDNALLLRDAQEAEARYRGLLQGAADAMVVANEAGIYIDVNEAAEALFGYDREEFIGTPIGAFATDRDEVERELATVQREGTWSRENMIRRKNGDEVPVETRMSRIELSGGPVYLGVVRDVSERRAIQRFEREFLSDVAHDLKNPLAGVKTQVQMLSRRMARGLLRIEDVERALPLLEVSSDRMTRRIDELVDVARLRLGQQIELRLEPTDLVRLASELVETYRLVNDRHDVRVERAPSALIGLWDPTRLERVLDNLLNNAVKYSPSGGRIAVTISEERTSEPVAILKVSDQGVGIPVDDLPRAFERFRRGSNVARFEGTGIGLSGARQIIREHGGSIGIESREGEGTTVTIRLPLPAST